MQLARNTRPLHFLGNDEPSAQIAEVELGAMAPPALHQKAANQQGLADQHRASHQNYPLVRVPETGIPVHDRRARREPRVVDSEALQFTPIEGRPVRRRHWDEVGCRNAGQDLSRALSQVRPMTLRIEQHAADDATTEEISGYPVNGDFCYAPQRLEDFEPRSRHAVAIRLHAQKQHECVIAERSHDGEYCLQRLFRDVA